MKKIFLIILFFSIVYISPVSAKANQILNTYEVIVVGGDPEGVAAAVAASRMGASVLLVSYEDGLGGLMTYGWLNSIDMNYSKDGVLLTQGIFKEFFDAVGGDSFDIGVAKKVFSDMVKKEKNITYIPSVKLQDVVMQSNKIKGVKLKVGGESKIFYGDRVIDATQDGDVMMFAGVPYFYGQSDIGFEDEKMCVTLIFKLSGVNWTKLKEDITKRRKAGQVNEGINKVSAWGFGDVSKKYKSINDNIRLRGLNIGKQNDGTVLINALQLLQVDGLSATEKEEAIKKGKKEAQNVVKFLNKNISSFKNAKLVEVAPELYIRETRHFQGEYLLKAVDVLENKDFWDKIAMASYPMDIQTTSLENFGFVVANPDKYSIPFRCLVPQRVDNLLIVGKAASYSSLAASSARVIPVGMCTGEAAGIASVYSIKNNVSTRSLSKNKKMIVDVQKILKDKGGYLESFYIPNDNKSNWAYESFKKLISLRLVFNGYSKSNVDFSKDITNSSFLNMTYGYLKRIDPALYNVDNYPIVKKYENNQKLSLDNALKLGLALIYNNQSYKGGVVDVSLQQELISQNFLNKINNKEELLADEAYSLAVTIIELATARKIQY